MPASTLSLDTQAVGRNKRSALRHSGGKTNDVPKRHRRNALRLLRPTAPGRLEADPLAGGDTSNTSGGMLGRGESISPKCALNLDTQQPRRVAAEDRYLLIIGEGRG